MRRARVVLFLFLVGGAAAAYYGFRNGWQLPSVPGPGAPADSSRDARTTDEGATRPTFDIVRAEPTGEMILAGRAESGWTVTVESDGKVIGRTVADNNGEWVIQPDAPLAKGEHSLQLKAQPQAGGRTLFSKQRLALSLSQGARNRPVVALTEEGKATRVLQMAPSIAEDKMAQAGAAPLAQLQTPPYKPVTGPAVSNPEVTFSSMDYEVSGEQGAVHMNGRATPGARILVYIDDEFAGAATADATGSWAFSGPRQLGAGTHRVRADTIELTSGKVLARAEINFDREAPKGFAGTGGPETTQLAGRGGVNGQPVRTASADGEPRQPPQPPQSIPPGATTLTINDQNGNAKVIIVRRGDTLWQIAQQYYGSGLKYTQIFQNNRDQIRDPNLIYPSQRFSVPQ